MEEENGNTAKLAVGIIVVIVLLVIGFFVVRGFLSKKTTIQPSSLPHNSQATPTPVESTQQVTPTGNPQLHSGQTKTITYPTTSTGSTTGNTYYYSQSQSNNSNNSSTNGSQSQNQSGTSQSQSQTLPNGTTQSQSQ